MDVGAQGIERTMEIVTCESIKEAVSRVSHRWPIVVVMTVKGNLRHRIAKLGSENQENELTALQQSLREVAIRQQCREVISGHLERPTWGNGAFFYCEVGHLDIIKEVAHRLPFELQSKHIVCSPVYESTVRDCTAATTGSPGRGREAFLIKRAGKIRQYDLVETPACPRLDIDDLYEREFDPDLLQHVTSGPGFQSAYPEVWEDVWNEVCVNEPRLLQRIHYTSKNMFTCRPCNGRALNQHVCFGPCSATLRAQAMGGSLFNAILYAAAQFPPKNF